MRSQRGLSLVEISLSLALVGLTTAMLARNVERNSQQLLAQAEAQTLISLQQGIQNYLNEYAMQIIQHPDQAVERTVSTSTDTTETIVLTAGKDQGQSMWPTIAQLKQLQLLHFSQTTLSATAAGKEFITGPIQIYALGNDETPQETTDFCLRDGCILRIGVYPDHNAHTTEPPPNNHRTATVLAHMMRQLGSKGLLAHGSDGRLYNSAGQQKIIIPGNAGTSHDVGTHAEVLIPSISQRKLTANLSCNAGYFGFSTASRSSADASEFTATSPTRCVAPHGQIPAGQQIVAYDNRSPYTGYVRLVCELSTASGALVLLAAVDAQDPLGTTDYSCSP